jgi:hypothetical protein
MVKIQRLPNGQLVITVPKRLAELKGWDKGTNLVFKENDINSFVLRANVKDNREDQKKRNEKR